jgi:hypothetical protein
MASLSLKRLSRFKSPTTTETIMQHIFKVFPLLTNKGLVTIQLGQCFRPNTLTQKIHHFKSNTGYAMWVLSCSKTVTLSFSELELAVNKSMELLGAVEEVLVLEVA